MIILTAGNTLSGLATVASKLSITVFGMNVLSGVETYAVLDQRQLATSTEAIYTVAASTQCFVKTITVTNTHTTELTFQYFRGGTAEANAITPLFKLGAGCSAIYEDKLGWKFFNTNGQQLVSQYRTVPNSRVLGPTGSLAESGRVNNSEATLYLQQSYYYTMQLMFLRIGTRINNISWHFNTTGYATPQTLIFGIYNTDYSLLAQSVSSDATPADLMTLALTAPYIVPKSGLYYISCLSSAGTMGDLMSGLVTAETTYPYVTTAGQGGYGAKMRGKVTAILPSSLTLLKSQVSSPGNINSQFICSVS